MMRSQKTSSYSVVLVQAACTGKSHSNQNARLLLPCEVKITSRPDFYPHSSLLEEVRRAYIIF